MLPRFRVSILDQETEQERSADNCNMLIILSNLDSNEAMTIVQAKGEEGLLRVFSAMTASWARLGLEVCKQQGDTERAVLIQHVSRDVCQAPWFCHPDSIWHT